MANMPAQQSKSEVSKAHPVHALNPFEEIERMFENFSTKGWLRPFQWERPLLNEMTSAFENKMPKVNVIERDSEILVKAELPGVEKKDLDISMTKNTVTIKGKTQHKEEEEKGDYYRCEISSGSYMRTLALPADVDEEKAKAKFKDGVLELTLPKVEKAHRRSIKVE